MTHEEITILRILSVPRIGTVTYYNLRRLMGSADKSFELLLKTIHDESKGSIVDFKIPSENEIIESVKKSEEKGAKFLFHTSSLYPENLKSLEYPPPFITYRGNIALLRSRIISIIGSRKPSISSLEICKEISQELSSKYDYSIASGLANGIDQCVHNSCPPKKCIAVLPGSLLQCYPNSSLEIYEKIIHEGGCAISLKKIDDVLVKSFFLSRNFLLSSISLGTVVIQCVEKSGSIKTAEYTLENNRELMVIPGNPSDYRFKGSNKLIQSGAHLVTSASDINDIMSCTPFLSPVSLRESENKYTYDDLFEKESKNQSTLFSDCMNDLLSYIDHDGISITKLSSCVPYDYRHVLATCVKMSLFNDDIHIDDIGNIYKI